MKDARAESGGSGFQSDESHVESAEVRGGLKKVGVLLDAFGVGLRWLGTE